MSAAEVKSPAFEDERSKFRKEAIPFDQISNPSNAEQGSVSLTHAFGLQRRVGDGLVYLDSDHIVCVVGKRLAIMGFRPKEMTFISEYEPRLKRIVALAANKKYLAVSEVLDSHAQISLISLITMKRSSVLRASEVKEIRGMSFGSDGRSLVCFASTSNQKTDGIPEALIMYWNLEKFTLVASTKVNEIVTRISSNPWNSLQFCISGKKCLRTLKLVEGQLQATSLVAKKDLQNFNDHVWLLDNMLVVAAESGEIQLYKDGEFNKAIPSPFPNGNQSGLIRSSTAGFLAADINGHLAIFQKSSISATKNYNGQEDDTIKLVKVINSGYRSPIINAALSPDEASAFCFFDDNLLASYAIAWDVDVNKGEDVSVVQQSALNTYHFHQGPIVGMDVCKKRPIIATCGQDKTVHVWNYLDKSNELVKSFPEEILGIAIHPLGFHVAVGFSNKLRQYCLGREDLVEEHEFNIKNCSTIQYSHGGHFIAAASANVIHIFNTVSFETVAALRGHTGVVKSICFSWDDKKLVSVSNDGVMYEWNMETFIRNDENVTKGCLYTSVIYNREATEIMMVGNDGLIRQVSGANGVKEIPQGTDRVSCLSLFLPGRSAASFEVPILFGGTPSGVVRPFAYPLSTQPNSDFREIQLHSGPVVAVKVVENNLFTAGEDGVIFQLRIFPIPQDFTFRQTNFHDLVLISKSAIEEHKSLITDLENKYRDLKSRTDYEVKLKELHFEELLKRERMEFDQRHQQEQAKYDDLTRIKETQEQRAYENVQALQAEYNRMSREMEDIYEGKLQALQKRFEDLRLQKEDEKLQLEDKVKHTEQKMASAIEQLKQEYENKLKDESNKYMKLQRDMQRLKEEYDEELRQQEEEYELEIAYSKERADKVIQIERDATTTLKGDNNLLRRKHDLFVGEYEGLADTVSDKDKEINKLKKKVQDLEEAVEGYKKEVDERNFTISQKEGRIFEIKQKNQELEKYRFVLDYKIGELKEELNPKDMMIHDMKAQIKAMDEELQKTKRSSEQLELVINDRELRIDSLGLEIKQHKTQLQDREKFIKAFLEDLHKLYTENDPSQFRAGIRQMYHAFVTQDSKRRVTKEDQERMQELARQRQYMEHSITVLKEKAIRGEERMKGDVQRKVIENAVLISDLNLLRKENWDLRHKLLEMESQMKSGVLKAAERVKTEVHKQEQIKNLENNSRATTAPAIFPAIKGKSTMPQHVDI